MRKVIKILKQKGILTLRRAIRIAIGKTTCIIIYFQAYMYQYIFLPLSKSQPFFPSIIIFFWLSLSLFSLPFLFPVLHILTLSLSLPHSNLFQFCFWPLLPLTLPTSLLFSFSYTFSLYYSISFTLSSTLSFPLSFCGSLSFSLQPWLSSSLTCDLYLPSSPTLSLSLSL